MALIVQKYGGTSLATVDCIERVADRVLEVSRKGHDLVVVVSAMACETDRLDNLAKQISPEPDPRELDMLLSSGEQVSISLLAIALKKRGFLAKSFTARQIPIYADDIHLRAHIEDINLNPILENIRNRVIPVVAGFQGINSKDDIVTLGRGGSDTTAVALAAALGASECQIYTDVDGIYTTDPRLVPNATKIKSLSFTEVLELSKEGAKVLQVEAVKFAMKYNIPVRVLSTFSKNSGTLVTPYSNNKIRKISGIAFQRKKTLIFINNVLDENEMNQILFEINKNFNLSIEVFEVEKTDSGKYNFTVSVDRGNGLQVVYEINKATKLQDDLRLVLNDTMSKLSLIGGSIKNNLNMIDDVSNALKNAEINFMICRKEGIKVSVILDEKDLERGVNLFHEFFSLGEMEKFSVYN